MVQEARAALETLGVDVDPRRTVAGLSMAVQQGIEIAKAILRKPRYIIFDEPTASLGQIRGRADFPATPLDAAGRRRHRVRVTPAR